MEKLHLLHTPTYIYFPSAHHKEVKVMTHCIHPCHDICHVNEKPSVMSTQKNNRQLKQREIVTIDILQSWLVLA